VPEELNPHPAPEMEEDIDRDGDRQKQAVETQTVAAGAALREVLIHCSRVEQTKERHYRDQSHHHRQGEHTGRRVLMKCTTVLDKCQWVDMLHVSLDKWLEHSAASSATQHEHQC